MPHEVAHAPALHTNPAAHGLPQPPQFSRSVIGSLQPLVHACSPLTHATTHLLSLHRLPLAHALPQLPQFFESVAVSTHLPLQSVHDGERWVHTPLRLSVFIEAPRPAITSVLEKHPNVRALVANGWLSLFQLDEEECGVYALSGGRWKPALLSMRPAR